MRANVRVRRCVRLGVGDGSGLRESYEGQESYYFVYGMSLRQTLNVILTLHSLGLVKMDPSFCTF